ncbi:hypothetical protein B5X24_HaOG203200 [Helicoverpa armigera]|uniref:Phospholipase A2 n=1 Tax=Helicoverpa armigera TaxID=29058 RepID=A0A2W1BWK5_HELAM|nr:hypothetical protein B5X24_HaOG203200 [Helicoverpa armigera]
MYHRGRQKMKHFIISAVLLLSYPAYSHTKSIKSTDKPDKYGDDNFDNSIIDFDEDYTVKYNKKYGMIPWNSNEYFNKETNRYTIVKDFDKKVDNNRNKTEAKLEPTSTMDYSVIPLKLISTTENTLLSIIESTAEPDLTVIPLSTTRKPTHIEIKQTVTLPTSTQEVDTSTYYTENETTTDVTVTENNTETTEADTYTTFGTSTDIFFNDRSTSLPLTNATEVDFETTTAIPKTTEKENVSRVDLGADGEDSDVPIFTELDTEDQAEVPEDYYDAKDVVPTTAPKTDALSVIFGLAGSVVESVVESVAERVVPKGIVDLFRRMQRQSEMLEAERLRSREENGGIGQFGRGILKTISSGISKPLSQLMAGARDIGSLDNDRGFVSSLASGVTSVANVANSLVDSFKDRVQAIYPGTVWCGDGRSATARSSDLGLFFFTDTCCRQHDACKLYIKAGETKYGLTNTGLFTRSHCSCDAKFRECLRRTNSLVSAQIGVTYFNILGPQCFRNTHPIVKCVRKTRITGQKCEEYELDYTKPRMWQWFDNETF